MQKEKEKNLKIIEPLAELPISTKIELDLSGGVCTITQVEDGKKVIKYCDSNELMGLIDRNYKLDLGLLPPGVRNYFRSGATETIILEVPSSIRELDITKGTTQKLVLPIPACLFVISKQVGINKSVTVRM